MTHGGLEPLQPGDPTTLGAWRLLGRLGAGGMGIVYLGERRDGTTAAVKAIHPHLALDAAFVARFRREVEASRLVRGPYVAELLDADVKGRVPWLATTYVPGPTLADYLAERGPLPDAQILALAAGLAEGLHSVHHAGVTHRDLKPSNVLITPTAPVIIDFGVATAAEATALTTTGSVIGSAGWMAPEQVLGKPATPATDIHAWAALVIFAASGEPPFGHGRAEALAYRVVHEAPDVAAIPASIRPVVVRALSKDPSDRPSLDEVRHSIGKDERQDATAIAQTWAVPTEILAAPTTAVLPRTRVTWRLGLFVGAAAAIVVASASLIAVWARHDGRLDEADDATSAALVDETDSETTTTAPRAPASSTTSTTAEEVAVTTAPPPRRPTMVDPTAVDYRNFTHAVHCDDGAVPVTLVDGTAALGDIGAGDPYIELFGLHYDDVDGDGQQEALVEIACMFGANRVVGQLLTYQAGPEGPVRKGSTIFSHGFVVTEGRILAHEPVYGPDDARCCPSSYKRDTYRWDDDLRDFILVASEPITEAELPW